MSGKQRYWLRVALMCIAACGPVFLQPANARVFVGDGQDFFILQSTSDRGLGEPLLPDLLLLHASTGAGGDNWLNTFGSIVLGESKLADYGADLAMDSSGNAYVLGFHSYALALPTEAYVLKYSSSGELLGAQQFSWSNHVLYPEAIAVDGAGNFYCTGQAKFDTHGVSPYPSWAFTFKCDAGGNVLWAKRWSSDVIQEGLPVGNGAGEAIGVDGYGDVWVAGTLETDNTYISKMLILKYQGSDGTLLTAQTWGSSNSTFSDALKIDANNNVYVSGSSRNGYFSDWFFPSEQVPNHDIVLLKFSSGGGLEWAQTFGSGLPDVSVDITTDPLGRVYVCGEATVSYLPPTGGLIGGDPNTDGLMLIFDAAGPLVQARCLFGAPSGNFRETFFGLCFGKDNQLYTYGVHDDFETALTDATGSYLQSSGLTGYPVASEDQLSAVTVGDMEGYPDTLTTSLDGITEFLASQQLSVSKAIWADPAPPAP